VVPVPYAFPNRAGAFFTDFSFFFPWCFFFPAPPGASLDQTFFARCKLQPDCLEKSSFPLVSSAGLLLGRFLLVVPLELCSWKRAGRSFFLCPFCPFFLRSYWPLRVFLLALGNNSTLGRCPLGLSFSSWSLFFARFPPWVESWVPYPTSSRALAGGSHFPLTFSLCFFLSFFFSSPNLHVLVPPSCDPLFAGTFRGFRRTLTHLLVFFFFFFARLFGSLSYPPPRSPFFRAFREPPSCCFHFVHRFFVLFPPFPPPPPWLPSFPGGALPHVLARSDFPFLRPGVFFSQAAVGPPVLFPVFCGFQVLTLRLFFFLTVQAHFPCFSFFFFFFFYPLFLRAWGYMYPQGPLVLFIFPISFFFFGLFPPPVTPILLCARAPLVLLLPSTKFVPVLIKVFSCGLLTFLSSGPDSLPLPSWRSRMVFDRV